MSRPMQRSLNGSLDAGATDGAYRKPHHDRGNVQSDVTDEARRALSPSFYGTFAEAPLMRRGDGVIANSHD